MGNLIRKPTKQPFQFRELQNSACNVEHNVPLSSSQANSTNSNHSMRFINICLINIVEVADVIFVAHLATIASFDTNFLCLK